MPEYIEDKKEVEVPGATGVDGYLRVIRGILEFGRVQEIVVGIGKISYRRFRRPDEPEKNLDIDLESLMPFSIIRGGDISEIRLVSDNAAICIAQLFSQAHMDGYNPVAFVAGKGTKLWAWHTGTTKVVLPREDLYGQPLLLDPQIPDEALILCAAYGRRAALVDTVRSYKLTIPWRQK